MTVDSSGMSEVGNSQQIEGVLGAIVSAISENMGDNTTTEDDSSDEEAEDSEEEESEAEEETSGRMEGATAEEVLDSLRADILRQLGVRSQSLPCAIIRTCAGLHTGRLWCRRLVDRILPTAINDATFELFKTEYRGRAFQN